MFSQAFVGSQFPSMHTFHLGIVALWLSHEKRRCLTVQGICWIWVSQKLWEEDFEDVDHVVHGRPCLVDDIEAHGTGAVEGLASPCYPEWHKYDQDIQFVNVGVEYSVDEADARTLVRILVG
jgi:hypothetical protein